MSQFAQALVNATSMVDVTTFDQGPSGGTGGVPVNTDLPNDLTVKAFQVFTGQDAGQLHIHQVILFYDQDGVEKSIRIGSGGSEEERVDLIPTQHIRTIFGTYGQYVFKMAFIDNLGNVLGQYGQEQPGSAMYQFKTPDGFRLVGFFGRAGGWIDAFGVKYRAA